MPFISQNRINKLPVIKSDTKFKTNHISELRMDFQKGKLTLTEKVNIFIIHMNESGQSELYSLSLESKHEVTYFGQKSTVSIKFKYEEHVIDEMDVSPEEAQKAEAEFNQEKSQSLESRQGYLFEPASRAQAINNPLESTKNKEPDWQSILRHPERNQIARLHGHNDFYSMASSQDNEHKSKVKAHNSKDLIKHLKDDNISNSNINRMNTLISLAQSSPSKTKVIDNRVFDFSDIKDVITQEEFNINDNFEWCAIRNGTDNDGKELFSLITKESLINNLENGNPNNPFTNKLLDKSDILTGNNFINVLEQIKI